MRESRCRLSERQAPLAAATVLYTSHLNRNCRNCVVQRQCVRTVADCPKFVCCYP